MEPVCCKLSMYVQHAYAYVVNWHVVYHLLSVARCVALAWRPSLNAAKPAIQWEGGLRLTNTSVTGDVLVLGANAWSSLINVTIPTKHWEDSQTHKHIWLQGFFFYLCGGGRWPPLSPLEAASIIEMMKGCFPSLGKNLSCQRFNALVLLRANEAKSWGTSVYSYIKAHAAANFPH